MDGRSVHAILGTPGGDLGEFIIMLTIMERVQMKSFSFEDVFTIFQSYLVDMSDTGKSRFFMGTDAAALELWGRSVGVANPLQPRDAGAFIKCRFRYLNSFIIRA